ncbi:MAG: substrate-binding domain-containing protein [Brevinema sp.]
MKHYISVFFLFLISAYVSPIYSEEINIFGPGGPHTALIDVAKLFESKTGNKVNIIFGPQNKWHQDALQKADMLFSASANQMTAFLKIYTNFVAEYSYPVYLHDSIILVQKGNPKKIKGIQSLIEMKDMRIIVNDGAGITLTSGTGVWEDILGRTKNLKEVANFHKKIVAYVSGSGAGRDLFTNTNQKIDAWITWLDWAKSNNFGEAIPIETNLNISRPLMIAIKPNSTKVQKEFVSFLSSSEAQEIFNKYGWYNK